VLAALERWTEAAADLEQWVHQASSEGMAWLRLGEARRRLQQRELAIAAFSRAGELLPDVVNPRRERAALYVEAQQWALALADYTYLLERSPGDIPLWRARAGVRRALGDKPGAAADLTRAAELEVETKRR